MTKLASVAAVILVLTTADSNAGDPRNESECQTALSGALETECRRIYAGSDQASTRDQCLNAIVSQVERVCKQFFGEDADFCASCNKGCTDSFPAGSDPRRECLVMCLNHQSC